MLKVIYISASIGTGLTIMKLFNVSGMPLDPLQSLNFSILVSIPEKNLIRVLTVNGALSNNLM